jgi:hypothetical protein
MDFAERGLAQEKAIGAARDRFFLCHPPRYEFRKWRSRVHRSMAVFQRGYRIG